MPSTVCCSFVTCHTATTLLLLRYTTTLYLAMIYCDFCGVWYHFGCVNMTKEQADAMTTYTCPGCAASSEKKKQAER